MQWSASVAYNERLPMSNATVSGEAKLFHVQEHTIDIQTHAAVIPSALIFESHNLQLSYLLCPNLTYRATIISRQFVKHRPRMSKALVVLFAS